MQVRLKGTQQLHWYENSQGHALIKQGDDWHYAELNQERGEIASVAKVLSSAMEAPLNSIIDTFSASKVQIQKRISLRSQNTQEANLQPSSTQPLRKEKKQNKTVNGVVKQPLLVVQVSFSDVVMTHDFTDLVFSTNEQGVKDYFLKNSYDNFEVIPAKESNGVSNDGVINITLNQAHPDCIKNCWDKFKPVFEEIYAQLDPLVDFGAYDTIQIKSFPLPSFLSCLFLLSFLLHTRLL